MKQEERFASVVAWAIICIVTAFLIVGIWMFVAHFFLGLGK